VCALERRGGCFVVHLWYCEGVGGRGGVASLVYKRDFLETGVLCYYAPTTPLTNYFTPYVYSRSRRFFYS